MKLYRVLEQHFGDKQYWPGDTRSLHELDAAPMIEMGLIAEDGEAEAAAKAEAEAAAKAEAEAAAKEAAKAEKAAKAAAKAGQEADKAQGGDLLDKAEAGAPQNKGAGDGNN